MAFAGGAGLLSTARDYGRFLQMLLNGGEIDGVRLLGPKTVELMTVNHVGSLFSDGNLGFGLGFEIVEDLGRAGRYGSVGEFGWGGAYHTTYWVDPQEKLVGVFMTQLLPAGDSDLHAKFRALVYQAIVGPPTGVARRPPLAPAADDHDPGEDQRRAGQEPGAERLVEEDRADRDGHDRDEVGREGQPGRGDAGEEPVVDGERNGGAQDGEVEERPHRAPVEDEGPAPLDA